MKLNLLHISLLFGFVANLTMISGKQKSAKSKPPDSEDLESWQKSVNVSITSGDNMMHWLEFGILNFIFFLVITDLTLW